jgi:hypothetical protein
MFSVAQAHFHGFAAGTENLAARDLSLAANDENLATTDRFLLAGFFDTKICFMRICASFLIKPPLEPPYVQSKGRGRRKHNFTRESFHRWFPSD